MNYLLKKHAVESLDWIIVQIDGNQSELARHFKKALVELRKIAEATDNISNAKVHAMAMYLSATYANQENLSHHPILTHQLGDLNFSLENRDEFLRAATIHFENAFKQMTLEDRIFVINKGIEFKYNLLWTYLAALLCYLYIGLSLLEYTPYPYLTFVILAILCSFGNFICISIVGITTCCANQYQISVDCSIGEGDDYVAVKTPIKSMLPYGFFRYPMKHEVTSQILLEDKPELTGPV